MYIAIKNKNKQIHKAKILNKHIIQKTVLIEYLKDA